MKRRAGNLELIFLSVDGPATVSTISPLETMMKRAISILAAIAVVVLVSTGGALAQSPPAYGPNITLAQAKKVLTAAEAEANENNWPVVIAVVDTGGRLVLLERLDNVQFGSIEVARQKAYSATAYRRSTKVFEDALAGGGIGLRVLGLEGANPYEGGLPVIVDGKLIGGIGVSGVLPPQDGRIARAGADALSAAAKK